jgi:ribosomal protein L7/L12
MTAFLAVFEFSDYCIIAAIVAAFAGGAVYTTRPSNLNLLRLQRQVQELQQKLDALLKHHGIEMPTPPPSDLSPEVQLLSRDPEQKIAAITLYRKEKPGVGLAEAKERIEEFYKSGR